MSVVDGRDPSPREWALIAYLCGDNPALAQHTQQQIDAILRFGGSDRFHVAVQWDLPSGAERAVLTQANVWERTPLGRVNTGDPAAFVDYLRWAFDQCPSERVIVVASGTGLLDPRASVGGPQHDPSHLFTVCDDSSAGDALSLSELGGLIRKAVAASAHDQIDILALDMRELQCLEVAYELEDCVGCLIAPQTRVPDSGWNFDAVLPRLGTALADAQEPFDVQDMAQLIVKTVGAAYETLSHGDLSLSALNLQWLKQVASSFDTLSFAMIQSVGDELVWRAREAVRERLKPEPAPDPSGAGAPMTAPEREAKADIEAEREYLYDLPEMLTELRVQLQEKARTGLLDLVLEFFAQLDCAGFARSLQSIDDACFVSGSRLRFPELHDAIPDPMRARQQLHRIMNLATARTEQWADCIVTLKDALRTMLTDPALKTADRYSWLESWPDSAIAALAALDPTLGGTYTGAKHQQQRLMDLAGLTDRVLRLLRRAPNEPDSGAARGPLVAAHFVSASAGPSRHGGVSLFRPRKLDQLIASDYLNLRFNKQIHWTVLLAVVNLIENHPGSLWRIISAMLATADNSTRGQLIDRIIGPGSVIAPFRDQFLVLAHAKAVVLSVEPTPAVAGSLPARGDDVGSDTHAASRSYRVRLEFADRDPIIPEKDSVVDPDVLKRAIDGLVRVLESSDALSESDITRVESFGETFGEDILQSLGITLARYAKSPERIHLQLQIPRDLMGLPWELMKHKGGWLGEDFAIGRQVFSRTSGNVVRARVPGALRVLVIGNPKSDQETLPNAAQEAQRIVKSFQDLAFETDGLVDFDVARDARINSELTIEEMRELLRHGNYDIVHFAGHAAFDARTPETSGWQLSDGRLSAQVIRNTLRYRETQPWLVFASACEAAKEAVAQTPYQTDVFGFASAFLDYGVAVFIGPLWKLDDVVAADTTRVFYTQLLKERQTVGESLRRAKVDAKRAHFDNRVSRGALLSWAGLVLYGNSAATIGQRLAAPPPTDGSPPDDDRDSSDA